MKRAPDFIVHNANGPYLNRWYLIPRNRFFNIYLHEFVADDDDRALHDHPWWSLSLPIKSGYFEWYMKGGQLTRRFHPPWRPIFRLAKDAHRVELRQPGEVARTVFITGPKFRLWGFHCPEGWVPWHDFVDDRDSGAIGRGCGEQQ